MTKVFRIELLPCKWLTSKLIYLLNNQTKVRDVTVAFVQINTKKVCVIDICLAKILRLKRFFNNECFGYIKQLNTN